MAQPPPKDDLEALKAALALTASPSSRRRLRRAPLPQGVALLLRIVAEDRERIEACAKRLQRRPEELQEAAAFYIEQILLTATADSYRVLGVQPDATGAELRQNLALLCRWLHSDVCRDQGRSVFFVRITGAWNSLKTPERRAAYDAAFQARLPAPKSFDEPRSWDEPMSRGEHKSCDGANHSSKRGKRTGAESEMSGAAAGGKRLTARARRGRRDSLWRRLMAFALGARRG